jgi:hypothetical protein
MRSVRSEKVGHKIDYEKIWELTGLRVATIEKLETTIKDYDAATKANKA